ncbi:MAG TPA: protoporphyrinogen oxidase HemJ [Sulfuricurvum sp.]|nr:protoporphyrinogen oxidase HemJ [Sulfuricurvum sp.]
MEYYSWILAFHVMSFISWMAMLFYLPRLYVYHSEHAANKGFTEVVAIQEDKLYHFIGVPAMWATILSGGAMIALNPGLFQSGGWLHAKLTAALLLVIYHITLGRLKKRLQAGSCSKSGKFFRMYNEVPTLLMIFIVIMVVVKPF